MKKIKINPKLILVIIFTVVVLYEAYLVYTKIYGNLATDADIVPAAGIVRLDLASYNKTISLLDALKSYVFPGASLTNSNPFH